ncbi:hypothetical protein JCM8202_001674 [Rhodotorula sphaerocarpa]
MVAAYAQGTLLAESSTTKSVDGNHYLYVRSTCVLRSRRPDSRGHSPAEIGPTLIPTSALPPDTIKKEYFQPSETHTVCPWKGTANYYNVKIGGDVIPDAAWYYPDTTPKAKEFENYVAFYKNKVQIHE